VNYQLGPDDLGRKRRLASPFTSSAGWHRRLHVIESDDLRGRPLVAHARTLLAMPELHVHVSLECPQSVAVWIDGLAQIEIVAGRDERPAMSEQRELNLPHPLAHPRKLE
jgi:hypothetical protein